jgi:hypothetical protein
MTCLLLLTFLLESYDIQSIIQIIIFLPYFSYKIVKELSAVQIYYGFLV